MVPCESRSRALRGRRGLGLDGLRDLLHKDRKRWDMVFALGGEQALAEMQKAPFQVVVSDMRMPGMDGAEFLSRVKERYPEVSRIVLSGQADRAALFRAMPVAHQFLSKPCNAGVLRAAIDRSFRLFGLVGNSALRAVIGGIEQAAFRAARLHGTHDHCRRPHEGRPRHFGDRGHRPSHDRKIIAARQLGVFRSSATRHVDTGSDRLPRN